jgi:hypothetical protein
LPSAATVATQVVDLSAKARGPLWCSVLDQVAAEPHYGSMAAQLQQSRPKRPARPEM